MFLMWIAQSVFIRGHRLVCTKFSWQEGRQAYTQAEIKEDGVWQLQIQEDLEMRVLVKLSFTQLCWYSVLNSYIRAT